MSYRRKDICVGNCEAIVESTPFRQIVACRGTSDVWDMIRNIRAVPWYVGRVGWSHAGFVKGARGLVDRGLYGVLRKKTPIILTGHSLGGALALNAAAILKDQGFNVEAVITFGAPRTWRKSTIKRWKGKFEVVQYINEGDFVDNLPSRWTGWRHANITETGHGGSLSKEWHRIGEYIKAINKMKS